MLTYQRCMVHQAGNHVCLGPIRFSTQALMQSANQNGLKNFPLDAGLANCLNAREEMPATFILNRCNDQFLAAFVTGRATGTYFKMSGARSPYPAFRFF